MSAPALSDELKRGEDGFERDVARGVALEQALGIHDPARFTPA